MSIALTQENKQSTVLSLSFLYGLVTLFYLSNLYSLGTVFPAKLIFFLILCLAPVFGVVSVYFYAMALQVLGKGDRGAICLAVAKSKMPSWILLGLWTFIFLSDPETTFFHNSWIGFGALVILSALVVNTWSFFLLTNSLKKLQNLSFKRSLFNVTLTYLLAFFVYSSMLFLARYIYKVLF